MADDASAGSLGLPRDLTASYSPGTFFIPSMYSFDGIDIALFSAGAEVSRHFSPMAAQSGTVVIDNSSAFRQAPTDSKNTIAVYLVKRDCDIFLGLGGRISLIYSRLITYYFLTLFGERHD